MGFLYLNFCDKLEQSTRNPNDVYALPLKKQFEK